MSGFENFHGTVDPEELFRTIFGQAGFKMGGQGGFQDFNDFAESKYGFAPATEVYKNIFSIIGFGFHSLIITLLLEPHRWCND